MRDVDGSGRIGGCRMIDCLALYHGLELSVTFYQVPVTTGTNKVDDLPAIRYRRHLAIAISF